MFFLNSFISYSTHKKPQRSLLSSFSQQLQLNLSERNAVEIENKLFHSKAHKKKIAIGKKTIFFFEK